MPGTLLNAVMRGLSSSAPSVSISHGTVHGGVCSNNNAVNYFRGLPYAKAPTGDLRFAAPQAYDSKFAKDGLDATKAAPSCIQFAANGKENGQTSEDCLFVDVWKPAKADQKSNLPVRVFLYGGDNLVGGISDPLYDGCNVADDAVMVSINYRLGALGYLALNEAGIDGNQGILDIKQGLQWVQDNIGAFGGDAKKVLLHGESAGAIDAFTVATLDDAPKLMSALISESGGGRHAPLNHSMQNLGAEYAKSLNCKTNDAKCLRGKNTNDLTASFSKLPSLNKKKMGSVAIDTPTEGRFTPYVDGKIIKNQPGEQAVQVPAIFGTNAYEGTLFALGQFTKGAGSATEQDYQNFLNENFPKHAKEIEAKYPINNFKNTKYPAFYATSAVITDSSFLCPASRALNAAVTKKQHVWTYRFDTTPNCAWNPSMKQADLATLGATHSAEIPFMLNATSHLPQPDGKCEMTAGEKTIASFMSKAWTSMASSQKPGDDKSWPAYGGAKDTKGINFGGSVAAGTVNYGICDFWNGVNSAQADQAKKDNTGKTQPKSSSTAHASVVTKTVTETGAYTTKETTKTNGKDEEVTKTLSGPHAVVTTETLSSSKKEEQCKTTTETQTKTTTGVYTTTESSSKDGKAEATTKTTSGAHAVVTTITKKYKLETKTITGAYTTTETSKDSKGAQTTVTRSTSGAHTEVQTVACHGHPGHVEPSTTKTTVVETVTGAYQVVGTSKENGQDKTVTHTTSGAHTTTVTKDVALAKGTDAPKVTTITYAAKPAQTTVQTTDGKTTTIVQSSQAASQTTLTQQAAPSSSSSGASSSTSSTSGGSPKPSGQSNVATSDATALVRSLGAVAGAAMAPIALF